MGIDVHFTHRGVKKQLFTKGAGVKLGRIKRISKVFIPVVGTTQREKALGMGGEEAVVTAKDL